jgi:hypothetical protein
MRSEDPDPCTASLVMSPVARKKMFWAVASTLPKNLIADPPCKVSNAKGFGGTCPLAALCAQSYEMEIPSLAAGL